MCTSTQFLFGHDIEADKPFILSNPGSCQRYKTNDTQQLQYTLQNEPTTIQKITVPNKTLTVYRDGPSSLSLDGGAMNGKFPVSRCKLPDDITLWESPLLGTYVDGIAVQVGDDYFVGAWFYDETYNVYDKHLGLTYDPYLQGGKLGFIACTSSTPKEIAMSSFTDSPERIHDHLFYRLPGSNGTWPANAILFSYMQVQPLRTFEPKPDRPYYLPIYNWQTSGPSFGSVSANETGVPFQSTTTSQLYTSNEVYGNSDWPDRVEFDRLEAGYQYWHVPEAAWTRISAETDDLDDFKVKWDTLKDSKPLVDWQVARDEFDSWNWSITGDGFFNWFYYDTPGDVWWAVDKVDLDKLGYFEDEPTVLRIRDATEDPEYTWTLEYDILPKSRNFEVYGINYTVGKHRKMTLTLDDMPSSSLNAFLWRTEVPCKTELYWTYTTTPTKASFDVLYRSNIFQIQSKFVFADINQPTLATLTKTGCTGVLVITPDSLGPHSQYYQPRRYDVKTLDLPANTFMTVFSTVSFPGSLVGRGIIIMYMPLYSHLSYL